MSSRRIIVVVSVAAVLVGGIIACTGEEPSPQRSSDVPDSGSPGDDASSTPDGDSSGDASEGGASSPVVAIAAGQAHACAAREDGTVLCWGDNQAAQLGTPYGESRPLIAPVPGLTSVKSLCAGLFFTCALRGDKSVACWGRGTDGRLGRDPTGMPLCGEQPCTPTPAAVAALPPAEQIACGLSTVCARTSAGDVYCWGSNAGAAVGLAPSTPSSSKPNKIALGAAAVDLSVGLGGGSHTHACVATAAGEARCWGHNVSSALGVPLASVPACPTDGYCSPTPVVAQKLGEVPLSDVRSVRVGHDHSCALLADGAIWCWGGNSAGALGRGGPTDKDPHLAGPTVAFPKPILAIEAHNEVVHALDDTKHVWSWGKAAYGAIGDGAQKGDICSNGTDTCRAGPVRLAVPTGAAAVATGVQFSVVLTDKNELWAWGSSRGELGHPPGEEHDENCGSYACNPNPVKVKLP